MTSYRKKCTYPIYEVRIEGLNSHEISKQFILGTGKEFRFGIVDNELNALDTSEKANDQINVDFKHVKKKSSPLIRLYLQSQSWKSSIILIFWPVAAVRAEQLYTYAELEGYT